MIILLSKHFFAQLIFFFFDLQGFEDMDLEEDKRDIINREIRMFRDMHKVRLVPEALLGIVLCSVLFSTAVAFLFSFREKDCVAR